MDLFSEVRTRVSPSRRAAKLAHPLGRDAAVLAALRHFSAARPGGYTFLRSAVRLGASCQRSASKVSRFCFPRVAQSGGELHSRALQSCSPVPAGSYARQAHDEEPLEMSLKIQNRARVRMGELIRANEKGTPGPKINQGHTQLTRREVAARAGISEDQEHQAKAMSRVPDEKREEMIERGATATEVAV